MSSQQFMLSSIQKHSWVSSTSSEIFWGAQLSSKVLPSSLGENWETMYGNLFHPLVSSTIFDLVISQSCEVYINVKFSYLSTFWTLFAWCFPPSTHYSHPCMFEDNQLFPVRLPGLKNQVCWITNLFMIPFALYHT